MKPPIVEVTPKNNGRVYQPSDIDMASGRDLGMLSWPNLTPGRQNFDGSCPGRSPYGHKCCLPARTPATARPWSTRPALRRC